MQPDTIRIKFNKKSDVVSKIYSLRTEQVEVVIRGALVGNDFLEVDETWT